MMKILHFTIIFLHLSAVSCLSIEKTIACGYYVGLEKMSFNFTPDDKDARWYHENRLKIKKTEVTLEKVPLIIKNGKKYYSASDGGFFYYRGTIASVNGNQVLRLSLVRSDYVRVNNKYRNQEHEIVVKPDGSIVIDQVSYKRSNNEDSPEHNAVR